MTVFSAHTHARTATTTLTHTFGKDDEKDDGKRLLNFVILYILNSPQQNFQNDNKSFVLRRRISKLHLQSFVCN